MRAALVLLAATSAETGISWPDPGAMGDGGEAGYWGYVHGDLDLDSG
jgi:hypothetical protein